MVMPQCSAAYSPKTACLSSDAPSRSLTAASPAASPAGVFSLPAGITKLRALACLDVSGCPLNSLPTSLGRLQALRHLRLNGTNIMVGLMHIWEPLAKLPTLESVEMRWVLGDQGIQGLKRGGRWVGGVWGEGALQCAQAQARKGGAAAWLQFAGRPAG